MQKTQIHVVGVPFKPSNPYEARAARSVLNDLTSARGETVPPRSPRADEVHGPCRRWVREVVIRAFCDA